MRSVIIAGGVMILRAMGTLALAPTAGAAAGDCPSNYVCMWEDSNYTGSMYVRQPGNVGSYEIDGWDGDNEISSVVNNTGKCVRLYDNDGWSGTTYYISKNTIRLPNLNQNGYNDEAESYKIFSC